MRTRDYLWVALGGMAGAASRHFLGGAFDTLSFAWGTLLANGLGTVVLSLVSVLSHRLRPEHRALLGTGFCGAFTTVSSLSAQVVEKIAEGDWPTGALYLGVSVAFSLPMAIWVLRWHPPEGAAS